MVRIMMSAALLVLGSAVAAQTANAPGGGAANATIGPKAIPGATREDKLRALEAKAAEVDTNDDGRLTVAEWTAAGGKRASFDTLDYNKDGVLTRQEFRSNARTLKAFQDFMAAAPH